jgi:hypothetical protein
MLITLSDSSIAFVAVVLLDTTEKKNDPVKTLNETIQRSQSFTEDDYEVMDNQLYIKQYEEAYHALNSFLTENKINWAFLSPSNGIIMTSTSEGGRRRSSTRIVRLLRLKEAKLKELASAAQKRDQGHTS